MIHPDAQLQDLDRNPEPLSHSHVSSQLAENGNGSIAAVKRVPEEVLLSIFKQLDSINMVKIRRVLPQWFHIINQNESLWKRFAITLKQDQRWKDGGLEKFDQMSNGHLVEFSVVVGQIRQQQLDDAMEVLLRSKETIKTISLHLGLPYGYDDESLRPTDPIRLSENFHKFPQMTDFRMGLFDRSGTNPITVLRKTREESRPFQGLEVLWLVSDGKSLMNNLELLTNLKSFVCEGSTESYLFSEILKGCSKTLKHLRIAPQLDSDSPQPLNFPNLKVLELFDSGTWDMDCGWISVPSTTLIITDRCNLPRDLPSVKELWASWFGGENGELSNSCPILETVRLMNSEEEESWQYLEEAKFFVDALKGRRAKVEAGLKVNGVDLINIKKVVVDFDGLSSEWIEENLIPLVEEVVNINDVSSAVEVEI